MLNQWPKSSGRWKNRIPMNADPPPPIVSLGDLVADVVLTIPQLPVRANKHQLAQNIRVEPGGAGNFLIVGSRLGLPMAALGVLGDDIFGNAVLDTLHRTGIDVNGVIQQPGTNTTTVIVLVDENGGHVFLGEYGVGPELSLPDRWRETRAGGRSCVCPGLQPAGGAPGRDSHTNNGTRPPKWGAGLLRSRPRNSSCRARKNFRRSRKLLWHSPD